MATFSLETLLKVLKEKLDLLREELAALEEKREREREYLLALEDDLNALRKAFSHRCGVPTSPLDLLSFQRFFPQLEERVRRQRQNIALTEEEIESKRKEIMAVSLRIKTLERLKEREGEAQRIQERRTESKALDELSSRKKRFPGE